MVDELLQLRNIGKAMRSDFGLLGISSVAQLAKQDPSKLYARIQKLTGSRHDPCVWDTYAAAIHQAKTGEALPWWHFTAIRKQLQADGIFMQKNTARRAINELRYADMDYADQQGQASTRRIRPLGLFYWGDRWTLGAWCELRNDLRSFRLDRMSQVLVGEQRYRDEAGKRLNDYLRVVSAE